MAPHLVSWEMQEIEYVMSKENQFKMNEECELCMDKAIKLLRHALILDISNKLVPVSNAYYIKKWVEVMGFDESPAEIYYRNPSYFQRKVWCS